MHTLHIWIIVCVFSCFCFDDFGFVRLTFSILFGFFFFGWSWAFQIDKCQPDQQYRGKIINLHSLSNVSVYARAKFSMNTYRAQIDEEKQKKISLTNRNVAIILIGWECFLFLFCCFWCKSKVSVRVSVRMCACAFLFFRHWCNTISGNVSDLSILLMNGINLSARGFASLSIFFLFIQRRLEIPVSLWDSTVLWRKYIQMYSIQSLLSVFNHTLLK